MDTDIGRPPPPPKVASLPPPRSLCGGGGGGATAMVVAASAAAAAASSSPAPGGSPSASSASHTHRASPSLLLAAACTSVAPSFPRGQTPCANAAPSTPRMTSTTSTRPAQSARGYRLHTRADPSKLAADATKDIQDEGSRRAPRGSHHVRTSWWSDHHSHVTPIETRYPPTPKCPHLTQRGGHLSSRRPRQPRRSGSRRRARAGSSQQHAGASRPPLRRCSRERERGRRTHTMQRIETWT